MNGVCTIPGVNVNVLDRAAVAPYNGKMENTAEFNIRALLSAAVKKRSAALEKVATFTREAEMHGAQVDAYQLALNALGQTGAAEPQALPRAPRARSAKTDTIPGGPKWVEIYTRLVQMSDGPYSYDELKSAAKFCGYDMQVSAIRAQMMHATNAELFTRTGPGLFRITELGLEAITAPKENGLPQAGSPDAGGALTPLNMPGADAFGGAAGQHS